MTGPAHRASAEVMPAPRLVAAARAVLAEPGTLPGPAWPRAAALLTRQALETAVSDYWARRAPGMESCNATAQLVALRFYADDPTVAHEAQQTWCELSEACHHHGYDLAPTAGELANWLDTVALLVDRLAAT